MSPLRGDVLGLAGVLALPLLGLWWRGNFTVDDVTSRLPWCLLAAWATVAVLRYATTPRQSEGGRTPHAQPPAERPDGDPTQVEHTSAS